MLARRFTSTRRLEGHRLGLGGERREQPQDGADDRPAYQSVLGIISTGEADRDRDFMKVLGFQDFGQNAPTGPTRASRASTRNGFAPGNTRSGFRSTCSPRWVAPAAIRRTPRSRSSSDTSPAPKSFPGTPTAHRPRDQVAHHPAVRDEGAAQEGARSYTAYKADKPCGCYFDFKQRARLPPPAKPARRRRLRRRGHQTC